VHDPSDFAKIFSRDGIKLKGNLENLDYYGLPLVWFGIDSSQTRDLSDRYGSLIIKIKLETIRKKLGNIN